MDKTSTTKRLRDESYRVPDVNEVGRKIELVGEEIINEFFSYKEMDRLDYYCIKAVSC